MDNGEWKMDNGEWKMENGKWRKENFKQHKEKSSFNFNFEQNTVVKDFSYKNSDCCAVDKIEELDEQDLFLMNIEQKSII